MKVLAVLECKCLVSNLGEVLGVKESMEMVLAFVGAVHKKIDSMIQK